MRDFISITSVLQDKFENDKNFIQLFEQQYKYHSEQVKEIIKRLVDDVSHETSTTFDFLLQQAINQAFEISRNKIYEYICEISESNFLQCIKTIQSMSNLSLDSIIFLINCMFVKYINIYWISMCQQQINRTQIKQNTQVISSDPYSAICFVAKLNNITRTQTISAFHVLEITGKQEVYAKVGDVLTDFLNYQMPQIIKLEMLALQGDKIDSFAKRIYNTFYIINIEQINQLAYVYHFIGETTSSNLREKIILEHANFSVDQLALKYGLFQFTVLEMLEQRIDFEQKIDQIDFIATPQSFQQDLVQFSKVPSNFMLYREYSKEEIDSNIMSQMRLTQKQLDDRITRLSNLQQPLEYQHKTLIHRELKLFYDENLNIIKFQAYLVQYYNLQNVDSIKIHIEIKDWIIDVESQSRCDFFLKYL